MNIQTEIDSLLSGRQGRDGKDLNECPRVDWEGTRIRSGMLMQMDQLKASSLPSPSASTASPSYVLSDSVSDSRIFSRSTNMADLYLYPAIPVMGNPSSVDEKVHLLEESRHRSLLSSFAQSVPSLSDSWRHFCQSTGLDKALGPTRDLTTLRAKLPPADMACIAYNQANVALPQQTTLTDVEYERVCRHTLGLVEGFRGDDHFKVNPRRMELFDVVNQPRVFVSQLCDHYDDDIDHLFWLRTCAESSTSEDAVAAIVNSAPFAPDMINTYLAPLNHSLECKGSEDTAGDSIPDTRHDRRTSKGNADVTATCDYAALTRRLTARRYSQGTSSCVPEGEEKGVPSNDDDDKDDSHSNTDDDVVLGIEKSRDKQERAGNPSTMLGRRYGYYVHARETLMERILRNTWLKKASSNVADNDDSPKETDVTYLTASLRCAIERYKIEVDYALNNEATKSVASTSSSTSEATSTRPSQETSMPQETKDHAHTSDGAPILTPPSLPIVRYWGLTRAQWMLAMEAEAAGLKPSDYVDFATEELPHVSPRNISTPQALPSSPSPSSTPETSDLLPPPSLPQPACKKCGAKCSFQSFILAAIQHPEQLASQGTCSEAEDHAFGRKHMLSIQPPSSNLQQATSSPTAKAEGTGSTTSAASPVKSSSPSTSSSSASNHPSSPASSTLSAGGKQVEYPICTVYEPLVLSMSRQRSHHSHLVEELIHRNNKYIRLRNVWYFIEVRKTLVHKKLVSSLIMLYL